MNLIKLDMKTVKPVLRGHLRDKSGLLIQVTSDFFFMTGQEIGDLLIQVAA